jgi:hypothetical protein
MLNESTSSGATQSRGRETDGVNVSPTPSNGSRSHRPFLTQPGRFEAGRRTSRASIL